MSKTPFEPPLKKFSFFRDRHFSHLHRHLHKDQNTTKINKSKSENTLLSNPSTNHDNNCNNNNNNVIMKPSLIDTFFQDNNISSSTLNKESEMITKTDDHVKYEKTTLSKTQREHKNLKGLTGRRTFRQFLSSLKRNATTVTPNDTQQDEKIDVFNIFKDISNIGRQDEPILNNKSLISPIEDNQEYGLFEKNTIPSGTSENIIHDKGRNNNNCYIEPETKETDSLNISPLLDQGDINSEEEKELNYSSELDNQENVTPIHDERENPYSYIFNTPNQFSMDDSNQLDLVTIKNLKTVWAILTEGNEHNTYLNGGFLMTDLSEKLVSEVERKVNSMTNENTKLIESNEQLEKKWKDEKIQREALESKNKGILRDLENCKKEKEVILSERDYLLTKYNNLNEEVETSIKLRKELIKKNENIKILTIENDKLFKKNQYIEEMNDNLRTRLTEREATCNRLKNNNELLMCYKEQSLDFMFSLMRKFNGIIDENKLSDYNNSIKKLSYSGSLINLTIPLNSQIETVKRQIETFYTESAGNKLLGSLLEAYSIFTRSKRFLNREMRLLRKKVTEQDKLLRKLNPQYRSILPSILEQQAEYTDSDGGEKTGDVAVHSDLIIKKMPQGIVDDTTHTDQVDPFSDFSYDKAANYHWPQANLEMDY